MENEVWRNIQGYEGYQVSNLGRVKSLKYDKEKILKSTKDKFNYLRITLCKNGKMKNFLLHRIVAQTFLPNPKNLPQINHIDENKENNRVDGCNCNLEWCDSKYNNNYGGHNERMAKSRSIPIVQLTKTGEYVATYKSATEVEKELGFNQGNINSCCKKRKSFKTANGYKWMYLSDYQKAI